MTPVQQRLASGVTVESDGFLGRRLTGNVENLLLRFDIDRYVKMVETPKHRDWSWIGEQPGKWLEAAADAAAHSGNAELRAKAQEVLERLLAAQEDSGYLGVTDPAIRSEHKPLRGMDPYELYFTLHALLTTYERWGRKDALAAAQRLGDYFREHVAPGKGEFWPVPNDVTIAGHSVHYGLEGTLLAHPMARLHRLSGETKYLEWAQWVVGNIDRWSGSRTLWNLGRVAGGEIGVHQIQPNVHAHTLHMNLLALLELYQATGDEELLRKARGAWSDIARWRMYVTGGVSVGETYRRDHELPNTGSVVETCATMSWMLLSQRLLELTGRAEHADLIERLLYNHLLAAQTADGDGWRYHTPLNGWKPAGCFTGPNCCSSSGPRILAKVPALFYARTADGLAVNQYGPSTARLTLASGNTVTVRQTTDYPAGETVAIEVSPERPERFTVRVRLPAWCERPACVHNGKPLADELRRGDYAAVTSEWKKGDRIELTLPMTARWQEGKHGNANLWCLRRGPLVYALDSVWCDDATHKALVRDGKGAPLPGLAGVVLDPDDPTAGTVPAATPPGALGPAVQARIATADGKRARALLLPFANVGVWYRNAAERRDRKARRHAYAVWLPAAPSGHYRTVDVRRAANVHSNPGRGLFTRRSHTAEVFRFARFGRHTVRGVPFDVIDPKTNGGRNLIILRGGPAGAVAQGYPTRVTVPVGARCRALHFLGGVGGWAFPHDKGRHHAATIRIRYDDAPTQEIKWFNGEHIADYNGEADVPGSAPGLKLGGQQLRVIRVRTRARSKITRVEISIGRSNIAPVVAAITAELPEDE